MCCILYCDVLLYSCMVLYGAVWRCMALYCCIAIQWARDRVTVLYCPIQHVFLVYCCRARCIDPLLYCPRQRATRRCPRRYPPTQCRPRSRWRRQRCLCSTPPHRPWRRAVRAPGMCSFERRAISQPACLVLGLTRGGRCWMRRRCPGPPMLWSHRMRPHRPHHRLEKRICELTQFA